MIQIGKCIYTILSGTTAVKNYVAERIYPLVMPENTILPAIVYERSGTIEYSRDGAGISDSSIDITVLSEDYAETINISQAVFDALNSYNGQVNGINILDIRISSIDETYQENAFIQKLSFTCKST